MAMNKVTKEWLWLIAALFLSGLFVVVLVSVGVRPQESLPLGIYVILSPVALVYLVRLIIWGIVRIMTLKRK
jgi:hypothetical protein